MRVLNAGLTLMPAGPAQTLVRLDGIVRLPHAAAGRRVGRDAGAPGPPAAHAGFLLADVAAALARPAPAGA